MKKDPLQRLRDLQRSLYESAYQEARALGVVDVPIIGSYFQRYDNSLPEKFSRVEREAFVAELDSYDILLYGDFHTLRQSQRGLLRILRSLDKKRRQNIALALEMFRWEDQLKLQSFLEGRLGESDFLEAIQYRKSWGFDWRNYFPIIEWAQKNGVPVYGINTDGTLEERDSFMADKLREISKRHRGSQVVCMVGEFHLADAHILREIHSKVMENASYRVGRIFTNVDKYFFSLHDKPNLAHSEYLRLGGDKFCVLNTAPWIKWQSLSLFEELRRFGEEDWLLEDELEASEEIDGLDMDQQFHSLLMHLNQFLDLGIDLKKLEDFYIHTSVNQAFLTEMSNKFDDNVCELLLERSQINGQLYPFLGRHVLVSSVTFNNLSVAAGEFLSSVGRRDLLLHNDKESFYANLLATCCGMIASKVLNPRRKGPKLSQFQTVVERTRGKRTFGSVKEKITIAKHVLSFEANLGSGGERKIKGIYTYDFQHGLRVSQSLGDVLGATLYHRVMRGELPQDILSKPFLGFSQPEACIRLLFDACFPSIEKIKQLA